jgi:hypothetical protein
MKSQNKQEEPITSQVTINHWMIKPKASGTTAQDLHNDAKEYFMWCEKNPIYKQEIIKQTGQSMVVEYPRPFNLPALCIHCGISVGYLNDMAQNPQAQEFYMVAQWIMQVIYAQNLEYGMVGIFSSVLTAKKLNLGVSEETKESGAVIQINRIIPPGEKPLAENEFDETSKRETTNEQSEKS